ncbi:MAG TPA: hypothetical protein VIG99_26595 [Myxococcaceae bacterium]|jgi:hypothetical protein
MRATLLLLLAFAILGCGMPPDETRLVLLDEAARLSGATLQLEHWEGSPAFAIRLTDGERPLLVTQTDARRLEVPAHSLAYVEGSGAQVRILELERDMARDALMLTGSQGAAEYVAKLLDAQMTSLADDRFQLTGSELLDRSAFLDAPRGLREVRPIERAPEEMRSLLGRGDRPVPSIAWSTPGRAGSVPVALVGVYVSEQTTVVLDAEGGFALTRGCGESEVGTAVLEGDRLVLVGEDQSPISLHLTEAGGIQLGAEVLAPLMEESR